MAGYFYIKFSQIMRPCKEVMMAAFSVLRITDVPTSKTKEDKREAIVAFPPKGRVGALCKIAAMAALLALCNAEVQAQYTEGMVGGRYYGYSAAKPWHTQALPTMNFNTNTASNGLMFSIGSIVQIEAAATDGSTGALFELQGFSIGTPSPASFNQFTGSLFTGGMTAAVANQWRMMINHAGGLAAPAGTSGALNLRDGVLWLIINWGNGTLNQRYEMTLNNLWQLVPRYGIFYRMPATAPDKTPCSFTFEYLQLQGYTCNSTVTGTGWDRVCGTPSAATLPTGTSWANLYNFYGCPQYVSYANPQTDPDLKFQVSNSNPAREITVCAGDVTGRNFIDMTYFKCAGTRYIQFEYIWQGTGAVAVASSAAGGTITTVNSGSTNSYSNGGISSGATTTANGRRLIAGTANTYSESASCFVRLPATAQNGDYLEIRMYNWGNADNTRPSNTTAPTAADRLANPRTQSVFIRVVSPTEVIDNQILDFCYPAGGVVNSSYATTMTVTNNLGIPGQTPTQAVSFQYFASNAAGTAPTGTAFTGTGANSATFNPRAAYVPAAYQLDPTASTTAERTKVYWVRYQNAGGCFSDYARLEFKVRDNISTPPVITGANSVCVGQKYRYTFNPYQASSGGNNITYLWLDGGASYTIVETSDGIGSKTGAWADIVFNNTPGVTSYNVRARRHWTDQVSNLPTTCPTAPPAAELGGYTIACGQCFSSPGQITVNLNPLPTATLTGGGTICGDATPSLTIGGLTGASGTPASYTVTVNNGSADQVYGPFGVGGTIIYPTQTEGTTVTYTITRVDASGNACPNDFTGVVAPSQTVMKRPMLSFTSPVAASITTVPTTICEGLPFAATLAGVSVASGTQLQWTYNGNTEPWSSGNNYNFTTSGN
ncbi:MAG: hypothetical protein FWD21_03775, partial [Peptococcaceae bacterium]|nr:hypothetical protein [Peptococcaceae bacterium]